ncbi:MAG: HPP family protein [bacterium]|nr:HPP family protein [bacterium]
METLNEKFLKNKSRCLLQLSVSSFFVFTVLFILEAVPNAVIIASFAASSFIVFTFPEAQVSRPRFIIGGYIAGIITGSLFHFISNIGVISQIPVIGNIPFVIFGTLSVGITITIMVITDTIHPPAASLALGLVIHEFSFVTVIIVFSGIVLLSYIKHLLKDHLKNLL